MATTPRMTIAAPVPLAPVVDAGYRDDELGEYECGNEGACDGEWDAGAGAGVGVEGASGTRGASGGNAAVPCGPEAAAGVRSRGMRAVMRVTSKTMGFASGSVAAEAATRSFSRSSRIAAADG